MKQSTELKDLTLRFYEAYSSGDYSFIARHQSQKDGVLVIGTDPNEWWEGYATITRVMKAQMEEVGVVSVVASAPQAYSEGTVGWVADHLKLRLPDGTEISMRLTAVFRKENNDWKFVLRHLSISVPNEDVFGKALTTK